jgi:DNA invertase Pin-like site-specific DNA recombinase
MTRVGLWLGYTRVSRVGDRAERLISPELQQARISDYADGRGLRVEMLEPELDQSGGKVERPILDQAIARVERGDVAGVIVAQLDRFSRMDLADALRTIQRIEGAGGQVIAVAENFDAATPEGRLGRNVFLSMAQMQLERYRLQFANAKARAVREGIWPAPRPPLGYTVTPRKRGGDGKLYIDPATAPKVKQAFELAARGEPWSVIATHLGVGISTAQKIVRKRAYLGETNLGDLRQEGTHEPLVSEGLFASAQISRGRPPRGDAPPALLAGLLRCAGCQRRMTPDRVPGESIYRCQARVAAGGDRCGAPAIIGQKKADLYITEIALEHLGAGQVEATAQATDIDDAAQALAVAEAELEAYQEVTRVSDIGADAFTAGMRRRVQDVEAARDALSAARGRQTLIPHLGDLAAVWGLLSVEERRHLLRSSLGIIWVKKGRGPAHERMRIIAAGYVPDGLSDPGRRSTPIAALDWEAHLEGEIRPPRPQDLL